MTAYWWTKTSQGQAQIFSVLGESTGNWAEGDCMISLIPFALENSRGDDLDLGLIFLAPNDGHINFPRQTAQS